MRFLVYEEIDPQDAIILNLAAFGWHLTPRRFETMIRFDERWSRDSFLYAVEGGRAVSQVIGLRIPTRTVEGEEQVCGVAGVATLPSYARKGISTRLMQELHRRFREEGTRTSFLLTSKSLVAYDMYKNLGYRDIIQMPRAVKAVIRGKGQKGVRLRRCGKKDSPLMDEIHRRFTDGLMGFVLRQKNFIGARKRTSEHLKSVVFTAEMNRKTVGYVVKREQGGDTSLEESVIPSLNRFGRLLRNFERSEKGDYLTVYPAIGTSQASFLRSRGYRLEPSSWGRVMVAPLSNNLKQKEISRLYGFEEGKFCILPLDMF